MGSNMAENHPVGYQWVMEARERGAPVIHVDPRFTRTSATASKWVQIRAGSDIAFLGGIVNYILENGREFREYVVNYTNAPVIVDEAFLDTEDLDGLFSGWDPETRRYDNTSWQYEGMEILGSAGHREKGARIGHATEEGGGASEFLHGEPPKEDPALEHPRCVYQLLKKHFRRYTPELVAEICGCRPEDLVEVAEALCANSGRERTSAVVYSLGWTQHTVGVQNIRGAAIIQLLLGNIGRPGGGIMALRGHAEIQGSTDLATLYDILPGYIPTPNAHAHVDLRSFIETSSAPTGVWGDMDAYLVSQLKAFWGAAATPENDFCFDNLPRITGDHSAYEATLAMVDGRMNGYFLLGENPAVGSANARLHRLALAKLEWLVVRDLVEIESAAFWYDSPEIETGELRPDQIPTEIFFLPAASHVEKDGSFTNTQRLLQWRHKAVEPKGDCRSDLWFMYHLGRLVREKLADSEDPKDRPVLDLQWSYPTTGQRAEPSAEAVLREINGWDGAGNALSSYTQLKADGSTTCGCWIYCGCFADEVNQVARKKPHWEQSPVALEWGWAWPANRRILYNRASADPDGQAMVRAQALRLVGRRTGALDRRGQPRLRRGHTTRLRASRRRQGRGRDRRQPSVHPPGRWSRLALCPERSRRRPTTRALRAARIAVCQPPLFPGDESGPSALPPARESLSPERRGGRRRRVPLRDDHLPADRAPHRRCDEPHRRAPRRAAARDVLRGQPRARRRAQARARWLGDDRHRADRDRGARPRNRANQAARGARPHAAPGRPSLPLGKPRPRHRRLGQRPLPACARSERPHPGDEGSELRHPSRPPAPGCSSARAGRGLPAHRRRKHGVKQLPLVGNPRAWPESYGEEAKPRVGFFTDTTVCIGCKACEVACKQWNLVPDDGFVFTGSSYDNTGALGANTWRHVAFIEQDKPLRVEARCGGSSG